MDTISKHPCCPPCSFPVWLAGAGCPAGRACWWTAERGRWARCAAPMAPPQRCAKWPALVACGCRIGMQVRQLLCCRELFNYLTVDIAVMNRFCVRLRAPNSLPSLLIAMLCEFLWCRPHVWRAPPAGRLSGLAAAAACGGATLVARLAGGGCAADGVGRALPFCPLHRNEPGWCAAACCPPVVSSGSPLLLVVIVHAG